MIDTRLCKTEEELYDAMECESYVKGIEDLKYQQNRAREFMRTIEGLIYQLQGQIEKYEHYIQTYKDVYPERPWEDIE